MTDFFGQTIDINHKTYDQVACCVCGVDYFIPSIVNQDAIQNAELRSLWCPNGHAWNYVSEKKTAKIFDFIKGGKK